MSSRILYVLARGCSHARSTKPYNSRDPLWSCCNSVPRYLWNPWKSLVCKNPGISLRTQGRQVTDSWHVFYRPRWVCCHSDSQSLWQPCGIFSKDMIQLYRREPGTCSMFGIHRKQRCHGTCKLELFVVAQPVNKANRFILNDFEESTKLFLNQNWFLISKKVFFQPISSWKLVSSDVPWGALRDFDPNGCQGN